MRALCLLLPALLLAGCSTARPVTGSFVGDERSRYSGTALPAGWAGRLEMRSATGNNCVGSYDLDRRVPGLNGSTGTAALVCTDGSRIEGTVVVTGMTSGMGGGRDQNGREFRFSWGG